MTDYKELYLTMMRATEQAIRILIDAQQTCEELYLGQEDPPAEISENSLTHLLQSDIV